MHRSNGTKIFTFYPPRSGLPDTARRLRRFPIGGPPWDENGFQCHRLSTIDIRHGQVHVNWSVSHMYSVLIPHFMNLFGSTIEVYLYRILFKIMHYLILVFLPYVNCKIQWPTKTLSFSSRSQNKIRNKTWIHYSVPQLLGYYKLCSTIHHCSVLTAVGVLGLPRESLDRNHFVNFARDKDSGFPTIQPKSKRIKF